MKVNCLFRLMLIFFMFCFLATQAQVNKRDVVYLKNGSIIKGLILEMVPNGSLKIETSDGSIFIYKMEEVEKTTKEEIAVNGKSKRESNRDQEDVSFNPKGYFIAVAIGPNARPVSDQIDYAVTIINGIQINNYLSLGLGVKPTSYTLDDGQSLNIMPIFLDARFYIPKKRIHPMFSFQAGYSIVGEVKDIDNTNNSYIDFVPNSRSGGIFMAAGAGMRIFINERISMMAEGGFNIQTLKGKSYSYYNSNSGYYGTETRQTDPALKLNFGIIVNLGKK